MRAAARKRPAASCGCSEVRRLRLAQPGHPRMLGRELPPACARRPKDRALATLQRNGPPAIGARDDAEHARHLPGQRRRDQTTLVARDRGRVVLPTSGPEAALAPARHRDELLHAGDRGISVFASPSRRLARSRQPRVQPAATSSTEAHREMRARFDLAERVGFEPTETCASPVFKTGTFPASSSHGGGGWLLHCMDVIGAANFRP
jgi:hypothetical protein